MARTKKHVPEMTKPVKKPRAYALRYPLPACEIADGELIQSGVDTLETLQRTDEEVNEIRRRKALSHAITLRVAEMQQPVTKRFAPLKGQMSPLSATENSEGAQKQSGVEAFQSTVNRRLLKLDTQAAPDPAAPDPAAPIPFASVPDQPERYVNEGVDALNRRIGHLSRYYMHK